MINLTLFQNNLLNFIAVRFVNTFVGVNDGMANHRKRLKKQEKMKTVS
jgi:hypothetical protein